MQVNTLNELVEEVNDLGEGIRGIIVSPEPARGKVFVAFGYLHVNPKDFEMFQNIECEYPIEYED